MNENENHQKHGEETQQLCHFESLMSELGTQIDPEETDPFLETNLNMRVEKRQVIGNKKMKANQKRISHQVLPTVLSSYREKEETSTSLKKDFFRASKQFRSGNDGRNHPKALSPLKKSVTISKFKYFSKDQYTDMNRVQR